MAKAVYLGTIGDIDYGCTLSAIGLQIYDRRKKWLE